MRLADFPLERSPQLNFAIPRLVAPIINKYEVRVPLVKRHVAAVILVPLAIAHVDLLQSRPRLFLQ